MLDSSKYPTTQKSHKGVYNILCAYGKTYIGETSHSIKERLKENEYDLVYDIYKKFSIYKNSHISN